MAILTGAAQGLGYATAELLAPAGSEVVSSDIKEDKLAAAVARRSDAGLAVRGAAHLET